MMTDFKQKHIEPGDVYCPNCDVPMEPVDLGNCNGWECIQCGYEEVDIVSFKLNNEH